MEIIRVGTKNQVECGHCGSLLRYDESDLRLEYHEVKAGPYDIETMPEAEDHYRAVVKCPQCGNSVRANVSRQLKRQLLANQRRSEHDL